eukprot:COSAG05_NODE_272_length_12454_cov_1460.218085_2_plen_366_part_00
MWATVLHFKKFPRGARANPSVRRHRQALFTTFQKISARRARKSFSASAPAGLIRALLTLFSYTVCAVLCAAMLSSAQRAHLDSFGYLHLPGLLVDRLDSITPAFEQLIAAFSAGHDGQRRLSVAPFLNHSARLCALLDDERVDAIARAACGDDYQYWNSDGNYFVGDTQWHSDGNAWSDESAKNYDREDPFRFFKIALYLDPVDGTTGALRVIPGSHHVRDTYATQVQASMSAGGSMWGGGLAGGDVPAVVLATVPGDVVVFDGNLKHSAWGGGAKRRMFTINYSRKIRDEIDRAVFLRVVRSHGYSHSHVFGEVERPLLDGAPKRRQQHLVQLLESVPKNLSVGDEGNGLPGHIKPVSATRSRL